MLIINSCVGIVSWGMGCGVKDVPGEILSILLRYNSLILLYIQHLSGVYADVRQYTQFIDDEFEKKVNSVFANLNFEKF